MPMYNNLSKVKEISNYDPNEISDYLSSSEPLIIRGLIKDWPAVNKNNAEDLSQYLIDFYQGSTIGAFIGDKSINGRYFYNDDLSRLNFTQQAVKLDQILTEIIKYLDSEQAPSYYVGSANINKILPKFNLDNNIPTLEQYKPLASIWISNKSRIAAHHDLPNNLACCVAGTRTFTLFPPDQVSNLYIGPLDLTPAGQAISLVDFHKPDHQKFPKFKTALEQAQIAKLEPGDALFLPSMWWHQVEAHDNFNVLVNYWWNDNPLHAGAPIDALLHSLLNIKPLNTEQKKAWQALFDYYVFSDNQTQLSHIPKEQLGSLNPNDIAMTRQLRTKLINKLNR